MLRRVPLDKIWVLSKVNFLGTLEITIDIQSQSFVITMPSSFEITVITSGVDFCCGRVLIFEVMEDKDPS